MRPYLPDEVERVRDITRPFLETHGEPIAWGWDAIDELGIKDIRMPDFGDPASFREGEIPVFWVSALHSIARSCTKLMSSRVAASHRKSQSWRQARKLRGQ
jgi:uncharacterized protein YcsI (UPF0317 family)